MVRAAFVHYQEQKRLCSEKSVFQSEIYGDYICAVSPCDPMYSVEVVDLRTLSVTGKCQSCHPPLKSLIHAIEVDQHLLK